MTPLISIQDLKIGFRAGKREDVEPGVEGISFAVSRGEILALVGESGSGKSITALSILQLLPTPPAIYQSGAITFTGKSGDQIELLRAGPAQLLKIRGQEIGMVFQEPMSSLNPVMRCGDQVVEAIRAHQKISYALARQHVLSLFQKVRLPDPATLFARYPHQLSGGQKQRVMIAMAISSQPSLLICDEPTTALDTTVQMAILQLVRDLQRADNMGVIFITHDMGVVAEVADRVLVLQKGRIVEEGTVPGIFQNPRDPYTRELLAARPAAREQKEIKKDPLVQIRDLRIWYPAKKTFFGKTTAYTKAVDGVSFEVYKGETLGVVGESGCGKTSLGRALLRLVHPSHGAIFFEGVDLATYRDGALKKLRQRIQIVFQDPYAALNPRLTIGSAIAEPLLVHGLIPRRWGGGEARGKRVMDLLEKVRLPGAYARRYPHEFSGGQRQRIVLARALALQPRFIVCDESVSALDPSVQAQVLDLLQELKTELGFTVVFISHDLSVVRHISDRILVMNKGRIEEIGDAETVYRHPRAAYTQRLIASIPKKFS